MLRWIVLVDAPLDLQNLTNAGPQGVHLIYRLRALRTPVRRSDWTGEAVIRSSRYDVSQGKAKKTAPQADQG